MTAHAVRPFSDLTSDVTGLLWLINRVVFHPRGYTLAVIEEDDGTVTGWEMLGDGLSVWTFTEEDDDECFARVTDYFASLAERNSQEGLDNPAKL